MKINIKLYLAALLMCGIAVAAERKNNEGTLRPTAEEVRARAAFYEKLQADQGYAPKKVSRTEELKAHWAQIEQKDPKMFPKGDPNNPSSDSGKNKKEEDLEKQPAAPVYHELDHLYNEFGKLSADFRRHAGNSKAEGELFTALATPLLQAKIIRDMPPEVRRAMRNIDEPTFTEAVQKAMVQNFADSIAKTAVAGVFVGTEYAATKAYYYFFPHKEKEQEAYARAMAEKKEAKFLAALMKDQSIGLLNRTKALTQWCTNAKEVMAQASPEKRKMLQEQSEFALVAQMQEIIQGTSPDVFEAMIQEQRRQERVAQRINLKQQSSPSASSVDLKKSNEAEPQTLAEALERQGA